MEPTLAVTEQRGMEKLRGIQGMEPSKGIQGMKSLRRIQVMEQAKETQGKQELEQRQVGFYDMEPTKTEANKITVLGKHILREEKQGKVQVRNQSVCVARKKHRVILVKPAERKNTITMTNP